MFRCLELARLGREKAAPNPVVGAVLVHQDRIIGEGFHREYGKSHAEVNCIHSVAGQDRPLISQSTLYVSLEPCAHFGKTPPCTDLIIENKIPRVVVGCSDPFAAVDGKGIEKLRIAGVEVATGVLENECRAINQYFFHYHQHKRPYIILKWAQSADARMAGRGPGRTYITNLYTNRLVHQWRSEVMAIMVGSNTVSIDDPELTTRHWPGRHPVRVVIDTDGLVEPPRKIFNDAAPTLIYHRNADEQKGNVSYIQLQSGDTIGQVIRSLYERNIHSVMVEGGAKLLQSFIAAGLWDEARVITNNALTIGEGLSAPALDHAGQIGTDQVGTDTIRIYQHRI